MREISKIKQKRSTDKKTLVLWVIHLEPKYPKRLEIKQREVITLNRPTIPLDLIKGKKVPKNQTDIRTSRDPVSILRPFQKANNKEITIPLKTLNPFREHSTDVLSRMHEDTLFGGVRGKVCENVGPRPNRDLYIYIYRALFGRGLQRWLCCRKD
jgi:hypothetical protein